MAFLLEVLGPAETKIGQAFHSYYKTPKSIAQHLKRLKSQAAIPTYWDAWHMIDNTEIVPDVIRDKIESIDAIYGGSVNITLKCKEKSGEDTILAIERKNAENRIHA